MLITSPEKLKEFRTEKRIWQGIPGIERTKGGRLYASFYSGNTTERLGNYCVIVTSNDDGKTWSEPIAAAYKSEIYRCYDEVLWIDPLGRLWFVWAVLPEHGVYASICENPDAPVSELVWGEEFRIGGDVMMNKPTVLSTGEWLFPIAVWDKSVCVLGDYKTKDPETGAFVYKTSDNGKTFKKLGTPFIVSRSFDEHMIVEQNDGSLSLFSRTHYGIAKSVSFDGGLTWSVACDSKLGGPSSRFCIRRLKSGRLILINHVNFTGRNNLAAVLSDDDGKTWSAPLMLDERDAVSYPDLTEDENGFIYVVYDRERGGHKKSYADAKSEAREILFAKFTEQDVLAGKLVNPESRTKQIVSKLSDYDGDAEALYTKTHHFRPEDVKELLRTVKNNDEIVSRLFVLYGVNCINLNLVDIKRLDSHITSFKNADDATDKETSFDAILKILESVRDVKSRNIPVATFAINYINDHFAEHITAETVAEAAGVSLYYLCHVFKQAVGHTILDYRDLRRMAHAKKLLCETCMSITEIALECGFDDFNYFTRKFTSMEEMSPTKYRQYRKA